MQPFWLTAYEPEIQRDMLGMGHHNLAGVLPSGVVLIVLVILAAAPAAPSDGLWAWLACAVLARVLALWLWLRFRPVAGAARPSAQALRQWMWAHAAVMSMLGLSIGLFGALFVPAQAAATSVPLAMHNLFLTMAFLGAVAYSAAGTGPHDLPAFLLSVACAAAAMAWHLPRAFGAYAWHVAGLCGVFTVLMVWVGIKAHRLLLHTIRLRLANERLAHEQAVAAAQAQQANRDKSEFLAAASHDLRQPVHAMVLLVEALKREQAQSQPDAGAPARRHALVASIGDAASAIGTLFNGLMELSRLESGHHQPLPSRCDLPALLRQVLARHGGEHGASSSVRLTLRIACRAEGCWLHTDRVMLERVIANLLSNALRYTTRGRVLVTLRLRGDGGVVLAVHDTGCGIAPEHQARIFEPYVQVGNAGRDRRQGLGLGLAIVRQCAQVLGVELGLHSRPGRGSRFSVTIPAALRCTPTANAPAEVLPAPLPDRALAGRRLLLIDDDPMVRGAMASLSSAWQVDLRAAHDGQDPLIERCAAEGWQPELLLCDYRLPGGQQGLDLLAALQERWPGCAALLQTGEPPEHVQAAAEEAGYPVLYKPVNPALLADTLRALLPARLTS